MARFTNQAQLRYGNEITNSNIAVGEITEVLSATKTAVRDTYGQNENVTYVISIVNSGTTAFNGITVTDNLGEYLFNTRELTPLTYIPGTVKYYANGILQATPAVTAGPPLTITGITVPAGGNVTLTYEAEVNSYAPLAAEASITNTATIAGAGVTPVTVNCGKRTASYDHKVRQSRTRDREWNIDVYVPDTESGEYGSRCSYRCRDHRYL